MIKIFRKIRQKMLAENKFNKYLLYAFGEIALVVIGILIALSINNWNQNKNNRALEVDYIARLINDFEKDSAIIEEILENTRSRINLGKIVISSIELGKVTENPTQFASAIEYSMWYEYPNYSNSTYTDLKSTGNLRLIQKTQLIDKVSTYYNTIGSLEQWKENFRQVQQDVDGIISQVLTIEYREALLNNSPNSTTSAKDLVISQTEAERMLKTLSKNPNAQYAYSNMVRIQIVQNIHLKIIHRLANETLNELRLYLNEQ